MEPFRVLSEATQKQGRMYAGMAAPLREILGLPEDAPISFEDGAMTYEGKGCYTFKVRIRAPEKVRNGPNP